MVSDYVDDRVSDHLCIKATVSMPASIINRGDPKDA
jgi:hypothetical protein